MAENTKKDIRNKVIYQIFTRNYKGGTFQAVQNDLDRIKALGVDIIYLLPIQPSGQVHRKGSMGSPYAIRNFREIDPVQGTMDDFIRLCEGIHEHGMKIMLDVVYNHTSPDSWLAENHPEWFYHKADGSLGNRVGEWWDVVDLDYSNRNLWDYQIDTLKMWAQYADGFRCDVAPLLPLDFWEMARQEVEKVRPGCIWLAESVEPSFIREMRRSSLPVLTDGELFRCFDISYDYDIYDDMKAAINGTGSLAHYLDRVNLQECIYPENYSKLRFLENHDRARAAALAPDPVILRNWTGWQYFAKGTVMLYAGQENAVKRHPTLFDRDPVNFVTGCDLSPLMSRLSEIKHSPIFAEGVFSAEVSGLNDEIILASYEAPKGSDTDCIKAIGIFSTTGRKQALCLDLPNGSYTDAISGRRVDVFEKTTEFEGEPMILLIKEYPSEA